MYTALPLVMIYLPTKFEGDLLKNSRIHVILRRYRGTNPSGKERKRKRIIKIRNRTLKNKGDIAEPIQAVKKEKEKE